MKTLFLLRHAKSSWAEPDLDDFDRPLNKRGRRAAETMGRHMAAHDLAPAQVLCSSARRTRETLELLVAELRHELPTRFEKGLYLAEAPSLLRRLRRLDSRIPSAMLIGHNPGLERLAVMLAGDGSPESRQQVAEKYPTGALAVLQADIPAWSELGPLGATLTDYVRPRDLETS